MLLNAHGGNENALRTITDDLTPKLGVPIVQFTYWYAAAVAIAKILETQGGLHACLRGGDLDDDGGAAGAGGGGPHPIGEGEHDAGCQRRGRRRRVSLAHRSAARSASGVIGNPEAASAEKGERLFEAISDALADKLCNAELWQLPWDAEKL